MPLINSRLPGNRSTLLAIIASLLLSPLATAKPTDKPRLILQLTVNELPPELLLRYQPRFNRNGFNYLLNKGVIYRDARHAHANTETLVGQVSLATGAQPANHGCIASSWLEQNSDKRIFATEDAAYPLIGSTRVKASRSGAGGEPTGGRSPFCLLSSTIADELLSASNGKARAFSLSMKDSGAIAFAGKKGKALWFSPTEQQFVSSSFYFQRLPLWVNSWNSTAYPARYGQQSWNLLNPPATYDFASTENKAPASESVLSGKRFPHAYGPATAADFSTRLLHSPAADELTSEFAKALISSEELGKDDITDYLAISFVSTEKIANTFGSSSLESEDNLLRLDNTLADLFTFIARQVGLDNTMIVLSAAHGSSAAPGAGRSESPLAQTINIAGWEQADALVKLKKKLGITGPLIQTYNHPYIYLNTDSIRRANLAPDSVQDEVAKALMLNPGVHAAIASHRLDQGLVPNDMLHKAVLNNHYSQRAGDIYMVFAPQVTAIQQDAQQAALRLHSAWRHDNSVALVFAGLNIRNQQVYQPVLSIDVAPTLAALARIKAPSGSEGKILKEVVE